MITQETFSNKFASLFLLAIASSSSNALCSLEKFKHQKFQEDRFQYLLPCTQTQLPSSHSGQVGVGGTTTENCAHYTLQLLLKQEPLPKHPKLFRTTTEGQIILWVLSNDSICSLLRGLSGNRAWESHNLHPNLSSITEQQLSKLVQHLLYEFIILENYKYARSQLRTNDLLVLETDNPRRVKVNSMKKATN